MKKVFLYTVLLLLGNFTFMQAQDTDTLFLQAKQLYDGGKYSETILLLKSSENDFEQTDSAKYGNFLTLLGDTYIQLRKFPEAEESLLKALSVQENKISAEYASISNSLGTLYRNLNNFSKSESFYLEALSIREEVFGKEHPNYNTTLSNLGNLYYNMGNYPEAEKYWLETKNIREKVLGKEHQNYAASINNLGSLYFNMGKYSEAENYWLETIVIFENLFGKQHPNYASTINNLGSLFFKIGNYVDAEKYWLEAKIIFEKLFGKQHPNYASIINNLGSLYYNMGNHNEAEKYWVEAKTIFEKLFGKEHLNYATSLNNLGHLYSNTGNYSQAEKYYLEAKSIYEKVVGKEHPNYASSLINLGNLYRDIGNYTNAEKYYLEAKAIWEKVLGKDHMNYATSIDYLGFLYWYMGNYDLSGTFFLEAKTIREEVFGKEHHNYAISLNNLGLLYSSISNYAEAEKYYKEAKLLREKVLGKKHYDYASSLMDLGSLYKNLGDYEDAEKYYIEAKTIREEILYKDHPGNILSLNDLSSLYLLTENYNKAESMKTEADQLLKKQVESTFSFLSERQRSLFWEKNKKNFEAGYSYIFKHPVSEMAAHIYDNTLFTKGLLLRTTNGIRDAIYSSGDNYLIEKYEQLGSLRRTISALQMEETPNFHILEILENRADSLDKMLTEASVVFKDFNKDVSVRWQDIQKNLQAGEAAIEFVHFKLFDGKQWSDTTIYGALLLKKDLKAPIWIPLFEENEMHDLTRSSTYSPQKYAQNLYNGIKGDSLYNMIWQPFEKELQGIKTVYYSPSGILHQVSFAAIPISPTLERSGEVLSDKYNLRLVSSTREIARLKNETAGTIPKGTAAVYGGLYYDVNRDRMIVEAHAHFPPLQSEGEGGKNDLLGMVVTSSLLPFGEGRGGVRLVRDGVPWAFLRGTKREAEEIGILLNEKHIQHKILQTSSGNEESFKQLSGTNTGIIHLATHGYFLDNIDYKYDRDISLPTRDGPGSNHEIENPMLRSGLLLSGSNRAWIGEDVIEGIEDGILTAEEISLINLNKTKLVVLSACKTGLGETNGYEGVFGLQRAFKLAGVETIIMSLWSIPDDATAELMIEFYKIWLSGKNKQTAFREAQQKIHAKYEDPYFWAGFVMMD